MKRALIAVLALSFLVGILNFCAYAAMNYIGEPRARAIAFEHARVSDSEVTILKCKRYEKNGLALYDIEFRTDNAKLDYEIDAFSGEVIGRHYKALQRLHNKNFARISGYDKRISETDAKAAAMKHAGISEASLREYEIELDERRGRLVYEIEFEMENGWDYEYEIDALTGDVLRYKYDD